MVEMDSVLTKKWEQAIRDPCRKLCLKFGNGERHEGWLTHRPAVAPAEWSSSDRVYISRTRPTEPDQRKQTSEWQPSHIGDPIVVGHVIDVILL